MPQEKEEKKHRTLPSIELTPSVSIIIAGVIIAGAIIFANHPSTGSGQAIQAANEQGTTASANVPAPSASDHIIGSPSAPIVLVEYSDFQCPYCQMIYASIKQIVSQSGGKVAWVMREFPLYQIHPQALPAANAAECIAAQLGSTGFWEYADAVFNNQSSLDAAYSASLAKQFGANVSLYNSCIASSTYVSKIQSETADAEASGGNGTPFTVVINTRTGKQYPISGAVPQAQIQAVINQAEGSQQ